MMNRFPFKGDLGAIPRFLPVVHVIDRAQAFHQVSNLKKAGVRGCFLISMRGMPTDELLGIATAVRALHRPMWVGVNLLGVSPRDAAYLADDAGLDGLWMDESAGFGVACCCNVFVGAAFKYQYGGDDSLEQLTAEVKRVSSFCVDILTTSGRATGEPATEEKLSRMAALAKEEGKPLAVASGVDLDNVRMHARYANYLLVSTSLEITHGQFDMDKVREMYAVIEETPVSKISDE